LAEKEKKVKHFVVEVTYTEPFEKVLPTRDAHRQYLQSGYERGLLLCSGAQATHKGGLVIARAASLEELQGFFAKDPYYLNQLASYRFLEFEPAQYQDFMNEWLEK
jgi:uncharacterized protein YciI